MTWNAEGLKNSIYMVKDILTQKSPSLGFISESQVFQSDIPPLMKHLQSNYCYFLNSEDLHDPEAALLKNTPAGGTLLLWRKDLDPFVTIHPVHTTAFTPLILKMPGTQTSIHIVLYLPTHGKDAAFVSELANLRLCIEELKDVYPCCAIFIRGDSNVNKKNLNRVCLLKQLQRDFNLKRVPVHHQTYHHFIGGGKFDSDIDVILHTEGNNVQEEVVEIICKNENPQVLSHHDIILSCFHLPIMPETRPEQDLIAAPRLPNTRQKIVWSQDGVADYKLLVTPQLKNLRESLLDSTSPASMSLLLNLTNYVLDKSAGATNKAVPLANKSARNSPSTPPAILQAKRQLSKAHKKLKSSKSCSALKKKFKEAQKKYKHAVRTNRVSDGYQRDQKLFSILTENNKSIYSYIKSCKNSGATAIQKLTVAEKVYIGDSVPDGFYESMTSLKTCDIEGLKSDPVLADHFSNHQHILKLCQDHHKIPAISRDQAESLLSRIKKNVKDYYSITAQHYSNAGQEGLSHFHDLLNAVIANVNNASIEELNTAHGLILYKGHNKEKTSDRAYRTISSCPFLAKALDLYLRDLYHELWDRCQAPTQYQGTGSSHELASLLITEVIQYSLYVKNKPVYLLSLDAQSAFDRCLRQILVCELHKAGVGGAAITFIDKRLENRATIYEWNGTLMGPGKDTTGWEQGGINSSDFYKLYNNEQLITAQASGLGVDIGSSVVGATGQADDVLLTANDIDSLALLVRLTEKYCAKYRVTLVPSKTKLIAFHTENQQQLVHHAKAVSQVSISGEQVKFVYEAEHVGVIRNTAGNLPNIIHRIAAHKKAMGSVLSAGLARGHRGNPQASLKVHQLYGTSVLFSGLASLVLTPAEVKIVDQHYQHTVQNLQKLYDKTPRSLILLMAGSLPGEAILHLRQLTLFSMICHLPSDPLNLHGRNILVSAPSSAKSWFQQILALCLKYSLDHPHHLLTHPQSKMVFKRKIKRAVVTYWEDLLRQEASALDSLHYFLPLNCNLQQPHPIWTTAGSSSFEVHKSIVLAKMVSGRFRTEYLSRHWTSNKQGHCLLDTCEGVMGDLEHLLIECPALATIRTRMRQMILTKTSKLVPLRDLVCQILFSPPSTQLQFFLEPLVFLGILKLFDIYGQTVIDLVFYCIRTYVYYIYRQKQTMLGIWPGDFSTTNKRYKKTNAISFSVPQTTPESQLLAQATPVRDNTTLLLTSTNTDLCKVGADPGPCWDVLPDDTGQQMHPNNTQLIPDPIPVLVTVSQPHNSTSPDLAVPDVRSWGCGVSEDTGQSAALDCSGVAMGYSSEGRAGVGHSSQFISYSDTSLSHNVVALSSPACNTTAGAGHHGRVVQLSSSYHTQSHHHQGPDIQ